RTAAAPRPLPETLALLDSGASAVTALIPDRFDFMEGETGNSIVDGGFDMFDGGNYLLTSQGGPIDYSNGTILNSSLFGPAGAYFTRKDTGLFLMAADTATLETFYIAGDLGADGQGSVDGVTLQADFLGSHYIGYVKRVYNAGDPSVNHMIIFEDPGFTSHLFAGNTNNDYDEV